LNTYPQGFISYNIRGEAHIQVTFDDPKPSFEHSPTEDIVNWTTKEITNIVLDDQDLDAKIIPAFQKDPTDPCSVYVLRGKLYLKISLPWLGDIFRQLKINNFKDSKFVYDPSKKTEVITIYEFDSDQTS
jgi:hypothetical protein